MKIPFGSTIVMAQGSYIPTLESIQFDLKISKFGLPKRTVQYREVVSLQRF